MQLFLIRHGIASSNAASDADRELTAEGRARFEAEVRGLQQLGVRLDRVFSSPLVRALQTARLLEPLLDGPSEVLEALAHEPTTGLLESLGGHAPALVGHEPWQSRLVSWLATGEARGSGFALEPGGVVALAGRPVPGGMSLDGFWRPGHLAAIGGAP